MMKMPAWKTSWRVYFDWCTFSDKMEEHILLYRNGLLLDRKQIVRYSVNRICEQNLCLFVDLVKGTMCPPSDVCWFRFAPVTIVISAINHSYWSYLHQLNAIVAGGHIVGLMNTAYGSISGSPGCGLDIFECDGDRMSPSQFSAWHSFTNTVPVRKLHCHAALSAANQDGHISKRSFKWTGWMLCSAKR